MSGRFAFLNLGHAYTHFLLMIYPTAVLALEPTLGRSYGDLIELATWSYVAIAIVTLPVGWLGDRWSRRGLMIVCYLGLGAASAATGFATTPTQVALGLFAIGLAAAIYHPVGVAMVAEAPPESLGRAMGVNGVCGNLGLAAGPAVTAALMAGFDWRAAFVVPGVVVLVTGLLFALLARPASSRRHAAAAEDRAVPLGRADAWRVGVVVAVATTIGGVVFTTTTVSLPKLMEGFADAASPAVAGNVATAVLAVAGFAQIVVGTLLDRVPLRALYAGLLALEAAALAGVALGDGAVGIGFAGLAMLLVFGLIPVGDTLVARVTPHRWRARVYAVIYQLSLGVSVAAVPLMALIHDRWGFGPLYGLLAAGIAIEVLAALALPAAVNGRPGAATLQERASSA